MHRSSGPLSISHAVDGLLPLAVASPRCHCPPSRWMHPRRLALRICRQTGDANEGLPRPATSWLTRLSSGHCCCLRSAPSSWSGLPSGGFPLGLPEPPHLPWSIPPIAPLWIQRRFFLRLRSHERLSPGSLALPVAIAALQRHRKAVCNARAFRRCSESCHYHPWLRDWI